MTPTESTESNEPKKRTITLTNAAPVTIIEDDWPVIAIAKDYDSQYEAQANRRWSLRVRQHQDGRAIVYGSYDTQFQNERSARAGELIEPGADLGAFELELVATIRRVASDCHCEKIAQNCIADLPAVELK